MLLQTSIKPKSKAQILFDQLDSISREIWCDYLFDRDLLVEKISAEQRAQFIAGAVQCGEDLAKLVVKQYGRMKTDELAVQLCQIKHGDSQRVSKQIFLATFTEPTAIKIYDEPINKLANLQINGFDAQVINQIVLGHELFHYFEGQYPDLYTQNAKVELWHFMNYHHRSTVRSTSEIAAMVFSWKINHLKFSPLVLDVLMLHCYNPKAVLAVRRELVALSEKYN